MAVRLDGQVAQLVEQRTENPRVGGSIPSLATKSTNNLERSRDAGQPWIVAVLWRFSSGPVLAPSARTLAGVISDEEAAKIRRKLDEGWRGPVLLTGLRRLLDDREERVRRERPSEPQTSEHV